MSATTGIILVRTLLILVLLGIAASSARADSDGYYCTWDDYLAYEFRFSDGGTTHRLYLVRFSEQGMSGPAEIVIPEFQVHGMRCTENVVEVLGWDSVYRVNVRDRDRPRLEGETKLSDRGAVAAQFRAGLGNLGYWNAAVRNAGDAERTDAVDLGVPAGGPYQIHVHTKPTGKKCEIQVTNTLVRLDKNGDVVQSIRLVDGPWDTECPEPF